MGVQLDRYLLIRIDMTNALTPPKTTLVLLCFAVGCGDVQTETDAATLHDAGVDGTARDATVRDTEVIDMTTDMTLPKGCAYPAQVLALANWKIQLPLGDEESPTEIKQPQLATYAIDPWFKVNAACDGVQFRAHTSAVTTSGSNYPRSELREVNADASKAAWSTTSGTHTMMITQAITAVPQGKKHVVAGQIHDGSDDVIVIRLEHPKLFIDIGGTDGPTLDANYTLGKKFTVKFQASDGAIKIYYNDNTSPAHTLKKDIATCYFKAGAYTQSNCNTESDRGKKCGETNFGEVHIYSLVVQHQ